ncbi:hypothetical protein [uncultured Chitinophaga sp.]|uniref:hypothetical protein n=1 Tax=uncultured Chitinophaga sp. TaxID=339340 RepID=UPI0025E8AB3E|nr:hypothetical protein [uncultured Chitinophaga sp.]
MSLTKITKGLFALKELLPTSAAKRPSKPGNPQEEGHMQAGLLGGSLAGLKVCLQKLYFTFKDQIKDDHGKQEELKRPIRMSLEEQKGHISRWENRIRMVVDEKVPALKQRIEISKEEAAHIRKNPQDIIGDSGDKPSFYIGLIILLFLTVYLFTFYSSASYSAFFKEFSLSAIGVANAIFDAQALSKAFKDGVMELVLILTIPFVFLGLGYLIHKMQEGKGYSRYLKIAMLVVVTFLFDAFLAYDITEKIYEIKSSNSFGANLPEYSIRLAISSINFWIIIFAGFIVYLIWGFVLDFVLAAFGKLDKVKVALREKEKTIIDLQAEILELNLEVEKMTHQIDITKTRVKKLNESIHSTIIPKEFEQIAFAFMAGWLAWMKENGGGPDRMDAASETVHQFVRDAIYNYPEIYN